MPTRRTIISGLAAPAIGSLVAMSGCLDSVTGGGTPATTARDPRAEVVQVYDGGLERYNEGQEARNEGIVAFNEAEYGASVEDHEASIEAFSDAAERFGESHELASELDREHEEAREIANDATRRAEIMREASRVALDAAKAADAGERASNINEHIEESQALEDQAMAVELANTDELAAALGVD